MREAATAIGVHPGSYRQWEVGSRRVDISLLPAVQRFLGYDALPPPARPKEGAVVLSLRRKLGLTQRQFAARFGVNPSTVRDWETGVKRPSPDRLGRFLEDLRG